MCDMLWYRVSARGGGVGRLKGVQPASGLRVKGVGAGRVEWLARRLGRIGGGHAQPGLDLSGRVSRCDGLGGWMDVMARPSGRRVLVRRRLGGAGSGDEQGAVWFPLWCLCHLRVPNVDCRGVPVEEPRVGPTVSSWPRVVPFLAPCPLPHGAIPAMLGCRQHRPLPSSPTWNRNLSRSAAWGA